MSEERWYKGNLHTHTLKSDGDVSPEKVARWYGGHGYDFLTLTDHDRLTLLGHLHGKSGTTIPLMIPGEEVVIRPSVEGPEVHINAIGISSQVIDAVLAAGGIASINHPNFNWALDHKIIGRVTGASLLEIFNGEPSVNMYGAPGRPSNEQIWDNVLSASKLIFGLATNESHNQQELIQ